MIETNRRVVLGGAAALLLQAIRDAVRGPEPVRAARRKAARRKSIKFDISVSQFQDDCLQAGGEFSGHFGEYSCCFPGWCMHCSTKTKTCRIVCDPGVKCPNSKRLPGGVTAALATAASQLPSAPDSNAPPDALPSGPPGGPPTGPGNAIDDDPPLVAQSD
jgi:hypothetical protein